VMAPVVLVIHNHCVIVLRNLVSFPDGDCSILLAPRKNISTSIPPSDLWLLVKTQVCPSSPN
jgi:hypothetical protein